MLAAGESSVPLLLTVYCVLIAASSLFGGMLPSLIKLTHVRMQLLISLTGGLMLGVGLLHQLPHALLALPVDHAASSVDWCLGWMLGGVLLTFVLLRMFHFHSHETFDADAAGGDHSADHDHSHDHDHAAHGHTQHHHEPSVGGSKGSWLGIFFGLSLHSLLDGVALAAHVDADALHGHGGSAAWLLGVSTFLGVFLHKPLDSLSITSLMTLRGWSPAWRQVINGAYALMCPLGALLFHFGLLRLAPNQEVMVSAALAMSAGVFVCIALSDLLPEVQFHSHNRLALSGALFLGVALAWGMGFLEPEHAHHPPAANDLSRDAHRR
ncbi:MAG: iron permease [Planctomycetaceae bacterium]|nr:iron permease [Planctomycetaceae bacterium]